MRPMIGTVIVLLSAFSASAQSWNMLNNPHFDDGIEHWIEASESLDK